MPLPDPILLPRLPVVSETRSFSDDIYKDSAGSPFVWEFTFEAQDGFAQGMLIDEREKEFVEKYILRGESLTPIGTQPIITERVCKYIAVIMAVDKTIPDENELKFTFGHWINLFERAPRIFWKVYDFAVEVINKARGEDISSGEIDTKNGSAVSEDLPSEQPQTTTTPTLKS